MKYKNKIQLLLKHNIIVMSTISFILTLNSNYIKAKENIWTKLEENTNQKKTLPNIPEITIDIIKTENYTTKSIIYKLLNLGYGEKEILEFYNNLSKEKFTEIKNNDEKTLQDKDKQKILDKNTENKLKNILEKISLKFKNYDEPTIEYIKNKKLTTRELLLNLIRKNFKDKEILDIYFKMGEKKIGSIISNDRLAIISKKNILNINKEEEKSIERIINKIKKEEEIYLEKKIPMPNNLEKPIVILTPGHGYEDVGAVNKIENKEIEERKLNANLVYYLTKSLLKQGFEVYIPSDITYADLALPKDDYYCHVIYDSRPPLRGPGAKCRMADALHEIIKNIFRKIQKNKKTKNVNTKICSITIHHNSATNENVFGFIPYYENSPKTSENFTKLSKKLANLFKKYGTGIPPDKEGKDISKVMEDNWVFCHFGGSNEKKLKEFNSQAAVMLEIEFMSNKKQLKKILNYNYTEKTIINFTKAICEFFNKEYKETEKIKKQKMN